MPRRMHRPDLLDSEGGAYLAFVERSMRWRLLRRRIALRVRRIMDDPVMLSGILGAAYCAGVPYVAANLVDVEQGGVGGNARASLYDDEQRSKFRRPIPNE